MGVAYDPGVYLMYSSARAILLFMTAGAIAAPNLFRRETSCPKNDRFTDKDWCSGVDADSVDIRISD